MARSKGSRGGEHCGEGGEAELTTLNDFRGASATPKDLRGDCGGDRRGDDWGDGGEVAFRPRRVPAASFELGGKKVVGLTVKGPTSVVLADLQSVAPRMRECPCGGDGRQRCISLRQFPNASRSSLSADWAACAASINASSRLRLTSLACIT